MVLSNSNKKRKAPLEGVKYHRNRNIYNKTYIKSWWKNYHKHLPKQNFKKKYYFKMFCKITAQRYPEIPHISTFPGSWTKIYTKTKKTKNTLNCTFTDKHRNNRKIEPIYFFSHTKVASQRYHNKLLGKCSEILKLPQYS